MVGPAQLAARGGVVHILIPDVGYSRLGFAGVPHFCHEFVFLDSLKQSGFQLVPLWFSPLGRIPVQAQLCEEKRNDLISREVRRS